MPTVVDELVVRLGLDAKPYQAGAKQAAQEFRKTGEEARRRGAEIEDAGKRAAAFFSQLRREAVALVAALAIGGGISSFVRNIVQTEAATGRLAHNLGMSTEALTAWQGAAKRAGGSAEATGSTLQGLTQEFQRFALTGQSSVLPYFRFLQVQVTDTENKMRPLSDILLELSDRFQGMDPRRANSFGALLGLDQGTINLLIQGRSAVSALIAEQERLGLITRRDAESGTALTNTLLDMQQAVERLGRSILTELTPDIMRIVGSMKDWLAANRAWLETTIVEKIRELRDYLQSLDWKAMGDGLQAVWGNG